MADCVGCVLSDVVGVRVGVCVCGWADGVIDALTCVRTRAWLGVRVKDVLLLYRQIGRLMGWPLAWLLA